MKLVTAIGCDSGGYYLEVFTDDDGGSGYGSNPKVGRWYGTREDCMRVDPRDVPLWPLTGGEADVDPFDLACERRFD